MKRWIAILALLVWAETAQATSYPDVASVPDISQITDWSTLTSVPVTTGQVSFNYYYPPTKVANLATYRPLAGSFSATQVTDATTCTTGALTGGGSQPCRVLWNGSAWVGVSGTGAPPPPSCPVGSTQWTTGVSNHNGITFSCSGTGTSKTCTHSSPITANVTIGSNQYTMVGYTPTNADIGKHLILGTAFGIGCSSLSNPCLQGAGGTSFPGETLEVSILSVAGQVITGTTYSGGSSSANAAVSLSGVEADIETDNGPALRTLVASLPTNSTICVPSGNYGIDTGIQMGPKNITFFGLPGATFYNMRNSKHDSFLGGKMMSWTGATGGGAQGLTVVGANIGGMNQAPFSGTCAGTACLANWNHDFYSNGSSGLTFSGNTDLFMQADADIELSGDSTALIGTSNSTVSNNYAQTCWSYGPSVIFGDHNTFSGNVMRNCGHDVEPNTPAEASLTHDNTFTGFYSVEDPAIALPAGSIVQDSFGAAGNGSTNCTGTCGTSEIVNNGTFVGGLRIHPQTCLNNTTINCTGANCWANITKTANSTGLPSCFCDSAC